jgi:class 3 adenylate cyclase
MDAGATPNAAPAIQPPSYLRLLRSDLRSRCAPERMRVVWTVRAVVAALTFGINGVLALDPPPHYDPAEAWRFFLATTPYFGAALVGLALHLKTAHRAPRFGWAVSLVMTGFEAAQIGISFVFAGPGHAITLGYLLLMVALYGVFIDAVHGLLSFIAGGITMTAAYLLYAWGYVPYALVVSSEAIADPEILAQVHWQALLVLAIVYLSTSWAGARIRWQQDRIVAQNTYITEQILRRYLPPSVSHALMQDGDAWRRPRRLEATVFFSDLVGFTRQSETLDPEALSEALDGYLTEMVRIAHRHGGTVDKFIGDAVMVLFGAPVPLAPEDQARQAVAMAIEMQQATGTLGRAFAEKGYGLVPVARMGIHFGEMVVGSFGGPDRSDFTAVGDNVNVASRLEGQCPPGGVLISEAVFGLLDGAFPGTARGEVQVKNRNAPIRVYEITVPGIDEATGGEGLGRQTA